MPWRISMSESTSKVSKLTPREWRIWTTLFEKPHWGINLLPFMNTKMGLELIRASMRERVESSMENVRGWGNLPGWRWTGPGHGSLRWPVPVAVLHRPVDAGGSWTDPGRPQTPHSPGDGHRHRWGPQRSPWHRGWNAEWRLQRRPAEPWELKTWTERCWQKGFAGVSCRLEQPPWIRCRRSRVPASSGKPCGPGAVQESSAWRPPPAQERQFPADSDDGTARQGADPLPPAVRGLHGPWCPFRGGCGHRVRGRHRSGRGKRPAAAWTPCGHCRIPGAPWWDLRLQRRHHPGWSSPAQPLGWIHPPSGPERDRWMLSLEPPPAGQPGPGSPPGPWRRARNDNPWGKEVWRCGLYKEYKGLPTAARAACSAVCIAWARSWLNRKPDSRPPVVGTFIGSPKQSAALLNGRGGLWP